jgi:hypothetical protein
MLQCPRPSASRASVLDLRHHLHVHAFWPCPRVNDLTCRHIARVVNDEQRLRKSCLSRYGTKNTSKVLGRIVGQHHGEHGRAVTHLSQPRWPYSKGSIVVGDERRGMKLDMPVVPDGGREGEPVLERPCPDTSLGARPQWRPRSSRTLVPADVYDLPDRGSQRQSGRDLRPRTEGGPRRSRRRRRRGQAPPQRRSAIAEPKSATLSNSMPPACPSAPTAAQPYSAHQAERPALRAGC